MEKSSHNSIGLLQADDPRLSSVMDRRLQRFHQSNLNYIDLLSFTVDEVSA
mgnify:FL=1|jgi:hypothetical protein